MRARSTEASVWPARFSTPPALRAQREHVARAQAGPTGRVAGSIAVRTVAARSAAEMPVVVRPRASIETVKAVPKFEVFSSTIGGSSSSSQRSSVRARQIEPAPLAGHEVDRLGRDLLGREHEVALVLAVLVVHDDDELPGAKVFAGLLDRGERPGHTRIFSRPGSPLLRSAAGEGDQSSRSWSAMIGERVSATAREAAAAEGRSSLWIAYATFQASLERFRRATSESRPRRKSSG